MATKFVSEILPLMVGELIRVILNSLITEFHFASIQHKNYAFAIDWWLKIPESRGTPFEALLTKPR